jgi:CSLREA domain-containing protein
MAPRQVLTRAALAAILLAFVPVAARAATITVNTLSDSSTSGDGLCSLREAINNANSASDTTGSDCTAGTGTDTINFSVSGTITLSSTLPSVLNQLSIDGTGQSIIIDVNRYPNQLVTVNADATLELRTLTVIDMSGYFGGLHNDGTLNLKNFTCRNNINVYYGGCVYNNGSLTINDSIFTNNIIYYAGVIILNYGTASIAGSIFANNASRGESGGAITNNGTLTVTNSTFFDNSVPSEGGAIVSGGTATVTNSTIYGNSAGNGGGVYVTGGSFSLVNSIVAGNANSNCAGSPVTNGGYNISDDASCAFGVGFGADAQVIGDSVASANIALDPSGLQDNGGPTATLALESGSYAIDAIPLARCLSTDQRGFGRPAPSHPACDVGAFEYGAVPPAPTITILSPANNSDYTLNQPVLASYSCIVPFTGDPASVCTGTVANGAAIDTASAGPKTFTVNATGSNNNSSSTSVNYTVAYNICPLYSNSTSAKSGATIPIKLQLCDINGADQSASGVVVHATGVVMVSSNASEILQDAGDSNPDDDFRFDSTLGTNGGYIFNLSTKGYPSGTFALQFTAGADPTVHTALFQVR